MAVIVTFRAIRCTIHTLLRLLLAHSSSIHIYSSMRRLQIVVVVIFDLLGLKES